ncbi:MAG: glycosyltransferase family 39 protein, partial [Aggregatilineales bacterium]
MKYRMEIRKQQLYLMHRAAIVLLMLFTFGITALVSERVFERLPHLEDEVAYLYQARVFADGDTTVDTPQPPRAYWQPFVVDSRETGQRFGKYTPGWSVMLAPGVMMGQPWLINALFAVLTVALIFRLGSEIYNPDVGLVAAILLAFSPMALLLNASLMGHTAALFYTTMFVFAYWRLQQGKHALQWGLLAGLMLGMLVISRPLSGIAVALPFIAWSVLRLLRAFLIEPDFSQRLQSTLKTLTPLVALGIVTLLITTAIPLFNNAATGDPGQNLYELVWEYDQIGFGECCGRNGHRLEKAYIHGRYDLSVTA